MSLCYTFRVVFLKKKTKNKCSNYFHWIEKYFFNFHILLEKEYLQFPENAPNGWLCETLENSKFSSPLNFSGT